MSPDRVSESTPVQVYLDRVSRDRLDRLAERLVTTRSEILRRGLMALEREVTDPEAHPVVRLLGSAADSREHAGYDVAREHDRYLAGAHETNPPPYRTPRRRKAKGG